jgi:maltooligosyltrehalose trehalohydrolase
MLFMGEEWGAGTPWQYFTDHTDPELGEAVRQGRRSEFASHGWDRDEVPDPQDPSTFEASKLDWSELADDEHARLLRWYRDLIRLRRERRDLRDSHLDRVRVRHDREQGLFTVQRGEHQVLVNLSEHPVEAEAYGKLLLSWEPGVEMGEGVVEVPAQSAVVVAP